jgi:hypothetical protein
MSNWKQVGGDITWERHGLVLAKDEPEYRQVHLLRVEPWLEHDKEAAVSHGLYVVDEATFDHDDFAAHRKEVRDALRSVGMEVETYDELTPEHKAEVLASYSGYQESRSVDHLAEALPAPVDAIEFWGGRETLDKLETYDAEMRREALDANFKTRLTFGRLPDQEALAFALGDDGFDIELKGADALAFEYAVTAAGASGATDTAEAFALTVRALADAPSPDELDPDAREGLESILVEWQRRYGDARDEDDGIAAAGRELASSFMTAIGFEWI